jgi:signal transduction histidine kinase/CheY-like chemotaxis protein
MQTLAAPTLQSHAYGLAAQQIAMHRDNVSSVSGGCLIMGSLIGVVLWNSVPREPLLWWLGCVGLGVTLRVLVSRMLPLHDLAPAQSQVWARRVHVGVALNALAWGGAAWLFFPSLELQERLFLTFALACFIAGAVAMSSFDLTATYIVLAVVGLPLTLRVAIEPEAMYRAVAVLSIVGLGFFAVVARRSHGWYLASAAQLHKEHERGEALRRSQEELRRTGQLLERNSALLSALSRRSPGVMFQLTVDAKGNVRAPFVSEASAQVWGIDAATAMRDMGTVLQRMHRRDAAPMLPLLTRAHDLPQTVAHEVRFFHPNGKTIWVRGSASPHLEPDGCVTWYGYSEDATERKRAEAALIEARDAAERANRAKSRFLSAMSHELRTPMNAILGFAQLLQSDTRPRLAAPHERHVGEILRAGKLLLDLINEVLDLARIEAGKVQIELTPVRVHDVLQECRSLMAPLARERGIELVLAGSAGQVDHVLADRTRLQQVLLNLLSNAIKYSHEGGAVRLACHDEGETLRIDVIDGGPGLTAQQQAQLFTAFERLGAEGTPVEGTGIGLTLSRRLVDLMQGTMGVESEPGRGSRFWVRLARGRAEPPQPAPTPEPAREARHAAPGQESRVLYIEDNPVNVIIMQAMFERLAGTQLLVAHLPELGLELACAEPPALILLDIQMPGMDGFEVLRRLREGEATRHVPVVAVSANAMHGDLERGMQAGFDAYLTKPVSIETLGGTVRRFLGVPASGLS